ncbi:Hypothetical predicted protein [Cloeon dipterum]|uniref:Uncharacterized protein n=1 Tax=Cloeon dipterum TaxID=197152 RepID=A0A8S1BXZ1_9INSE|nr:Hypothetical predicted protein [Cloeon dipterum]
MAFHFTAPATKVLQMKQRTPPYSFSPSTCLALKGRSCEAASTFPQQSALGAISFVWPKSFLAMNMSRPERSLM